MHGELSQEATVECKVTYPLKTGGRFFIGENVPARACEETGEEFCALNTVEKPHALIRGQAQPKLVSETPMSEFAA